MENGEVVENNIVFSHEIELSQLAKSIDVEMEDVVLEGDMIPSQSVVKSLHYRIDLVCVSDDSPTKTVGQPQDKPLEMDKKANEQPYQESPEKMRKTIENQASEIVLMKYQ